MLDTLIGKEGAYSNHPSDRGGETMWGITIAVARANGYAGPMRNMTRDQAKAIYRKKYWEAPGFDEVAKRSEAVAEELFDTGVNMGPSIPSGFLQRLLNGLNRQGKDYADIKVDNDVGPATLRALDALYAKRGKQASTVLVKGLNALQGERYVSLAEGRSANEDFLYGWLLNRT
jgi:lysozyme family protein